LVKNISIILITLCTLSTTAKDETPQSREPQRSYSPRELLYLRHSPLSQPSENLLRVLHALQEEPRENQNRR